MGKDRRILRNVLARLVQLAKNTRYIFTYIKSDPKFKFTTNKIIQRTLDVLKRAFNLGKKATSSPRNTKIKDLSGFGGGLGKKKQCVSYEFIHEANGKSKRGSNPKSSELGSVEVDADATVGQIKDAIMGKIRTWLDAHYEDSNLRAIRSSLKIISIEDC